MISQQPADFSDDPTASEEFDTSPDALRGLQSEFGLESAALPPVSWAADEEHPDFAHTLDTAVDPADSFTFNKEVFDLLLRANHFRAKGTNGMIAFGLRGGALVGKDRQEDVAGVTIKDTRPNHKDFRCTLGIVDTEAGTISAFAGSTVPNQPWMENYYKLKNNIPTPKKTRANLLPTGCYIYRVNAHSGGKINPALRMTDPDNLTADAVCTVLRTHDDLTYTHDDLWDRSTPFDNIHCAYSDSSFSSAGCQTIKGADGQGPWGAFQKRIGVLGWNARIDYVLLTGREVGIAAAIIAAGKADDMDFVRTSLERLRVGSEGDVVTALQKRLGFNGTGYFGPSTKKRLTERERDNGRPSDGIYDPKDDAKTGWGIFGTTEIPPAATEIQQATPPLWTMAPGSDPVTPSGMWHNDEATGGMRFSPNTQQKETAITGNLMLISGDKSFPVTIDATLTTQADVDLILVAKPLTLQEPLAAPAVTGDGAKITAAAFDAFAPNARSDYRDAFLQHGDAILATHAINANRRRLSHFLAQLAHESGDFRFRIESLNYTSAERIMATWPSRFPTAASAQPFVRNEKALANKVYADRMGNTEPGDGFRYRGRGLIQLTGRSAYRSFGEKLGLDLEGQPDLAFAPEAALQIAAAYWGTRKLKGERTLNFVADDDKLRTVTYRINGGYTNLPHRAERLDDAKGLFGDDGPAVPVTPISERGDKDDGARLLQKLLIARGHLQGTADGKFGFNTYKALRAFKEARGLADVGFADPATFEAARQQDPLESLTAPDDLPIIGEEPEPIRIGPPHFEERERHD